MRRDVRAIWDQVKANSAKLEACPCHRFAGGPVQIGQRHLCLECGGEMAGSDLLWYIRGYEAAGGAADIIYPRWHTKG
jgi:hypothetical protein